jgi:hypothetical protein
MILQIETRRMAHRNSARLGRIEETLKLPPCDGDPNCREK